MKSSLNLQKEKKTIINAIFLVGIFVCIAKLIGAAKEVMVASQFGVGVVVDTYSLVFNFIQWPIVLFGIVFTATLIPIMIKNSNSEKLELEEFRAEIFGAVILISLILATIYYFLFTGLLSGDFFSLSEEREALSKEYLLGLIILVPLGFIASLFSSLLMIRGRHINTILEATPSFFIIIAIPILMNYQALVLGGVVGSCIQVLILGGILYFLKMLQWPSFKFRSRLWKGVMAGLGIMLIGQFLITLVPLVDQYYAARLEDGALSILNYSERILGLILALGATVIGRAVLPTFSAISSTDENAVVSISLKIAAVLFLLGSVCSYFLSVFAYDIVQIIYERGNFLESDTKLVAELLSISGMQTPFYLGGMVLAYALISQQRYFEIVGINLCNFIVKLIVAYILIPKIGLEGIAVSSVAVYFTSSLICLSLLLFYKSNKINNYERK